MEDEQDFHRKWNSCFVVLRETGYVAQLLQIHRGKMHFDCPEFGRFTIPYDEGYREIVQFALPTPGYYQIGSYAFMLLRSGTRQFCAGLGRHNYALVNPIRYAFDMNASCIWNVPSNDINFVTAAAILKPPKEVCLPVEAKLQLIMSLEDKTYISMPLSRRFAASVSPVSEGLLLYLYSHLVGELNPITKTCVVFNPVFKQEVSDFLRDSNLGYQCVEKAAPNAEQDY